MAYAGTLVTQGQGLGIVVATAANTELGRVNQMLANVEQLTTPLLRQMSQFARYLTLIIVLVGVLYSPWLQALFATQPLSFADGLICVAAGVLLFILLEIEKWLQRRYMAEPIGKGHDG